MNTRIFVLALTCAGISLAATPSAQADARDDVLAGVIRCGVIQDDRVWLECVYGAQQPMRARLNLPPAPEFQQRLVPPVPAGAAAALAPRSLPRVASAAPPPRRKPGFLGSLLGDPPSYAVSRVTDFRFEKSGAFIVSLENGQQWRQTDIEAGPAVWTRKPSAYTATIVAGSFNSYQLSVTGSQRKYRVERLR